MTSLEFRSLQKTRINGSSANLQRQTPPIAFSESGQESDGVLKTVTKAVTTLPYVFRLLAKIQTKTKESRWK